MYVYTHTYIYIYIFRGYQADTPRQWDPLPPGAFAAAQRLPLLQAAEPRAQQHPAQVRGALPRGAVSASFFWLVGFRGPTKTDKTCLFVCLFVCSFEFQRFCWFYLVLQCPWANKEGETTCFFLSETDLSAWNFRSTSGTTSRKLAFGGRQVDLYFERKPRVKLTTQTLGWF